MNNRSISKNQRVFIRWPAWCVCVCLLAVAPPLSSGNPPKRAVATGPSPYSVKFTFELKDLIGDLATSERGDAHQQTAIPFEKWYAESTRKSYGTWGPRARRLDPLPKLSAKSAAWKRERIIAVALRYEGYAYQHHHLPDWDPPAAWPWKKVSAGRNGKGVDCSNFTGFVFNLALGVQMPTKVETQAAQTFVEEASRRVEIERLERPKSYRACISELRIGDLLYFHDRTGRITHVALWIGTIGQSPGGVPLVLDSTDTTRPSGPGQTIPTGVHLRPFLESGWYFQHLSQVHRIFRDEATTRPTHAPLH